MRITRFLAGFMTALATAGGATAQYGAGGMPATGPDPGLVPSVFPADFAEAAPGFGVPRMPSGRPAAAANTTALDRVTAPVRQVGDVQSDPVGTLTGQPVQQLPYGAYPSPYFTDGPGCCGPLGRNGRIGYELYTYVGINWPFGEGAFGRHLNTGIVVGGGGRSLFFNTTHDAAWVCDLGLSYTYNRGELAHEVFADVRQAPVQINQGGNQITLPRPDVLTQVAIRGLYRTNFNFALGRDWWLWGAGSTGISDGLNWRVGGLVGGRWGTAHVDLVPVNAARFGDYARRQNVTHGVFLATHSTVDIPMGAWILFGGFRFEWGYDWTNLIPPLEGNLHNFNLMMTAGIRF